MNLFNFIKDNSVWIVPIIIALITTIWGVSKRVSNKRNQSIKNIKNSTVNNINGDIHKGSSNMKNKR